MNTSSVARQNRRKKKAEANRILPPLNLNTQQQTLSLSEFTSNNTTDFSDTLSNASISEKYEVSRGKRTKLTPEKTVATIPEENFMSLDDCSYVNCGTCSHPIGKIFIEDERGFKVIDAAENLTSRCELVHQPENNTAIYLASTTARYFHNLSNICHGLLGGFSLLQCLLLYYLTTAHPFSDETLKIFGFLSKPCNNLFNVMCVICCVSAFDRYDIANPKHLLKCIKSCNWIIIIIILYPLCLLLSISTANADEKLSLNSHNFSNIAASDLEVGEQELFYWKTLSLIKCIGAVLAWFIVASEPTYNLLLKNLESISKNGKL